MVAVTGLLYSSIHENKELTGSCHSSVLVYPLTPSIHIIMSLLLSAAEHK
jgi:hypothetical protein